MSAIQLRPRIEDISALDLIGIAKETKEATDGRVLAYTDGARVIFSDHKPPGFQPVRTEFPPTFYDVYYEVDRLSWLNELDISTCLAA